MAPPSPALLIPRNMNQYSSSSSTAAKKAWSSFTCLLKNCFAHSPLNLICAIWMLCMYICHPPLESEWQSWRFLGLPATSPISGTGTSHSPENWYCGCVSMTEPGRFVPGVLFPRCRTQDNIPLHLWEPLWGCISALLFPNLPGSWIPNWNTHQLSEKLMQNGAAYWTNTTLRDFIPHGCFLRVLNKPSLGALLVFLHRQDFHFISWKSAASATIPAMINNTTRTTSQLALSFIAVH